MENKAKYIVCYNKETLFIQNDEDLQKLIEKDSKYLDAELASLVKLPNNRTSYFFDPEYRTVKEYLSDDRKEFIKAMKKQFDKLSMNEADNLFKRK